MVLEMSAFDILEHIKTPEDQAAYLEAAMEFDDPDYLVRAIGNIARARGVTAFAAESGLSREAIYRAFGPGGNPTLDTLSKATKALGLRLAVVAISPGG